LHQIIQPFNYSGEVKLAELNSSFRISHNFVDNHPPSHSHYISDVNFPMISDSIIDQVENRGIKLEEIDIEYLGLSIALIRHLKRGDINNIGQLCHSKRKAIFNLRQIGIGKFNLIQEALQTYLANKLVNIEKTNAPQPALLPMGQSSSIDEEMDYIVNKLTKRELFVFRHRYNLDRHMTLEAIGNNFGITRERVRQIESAGINKLSYYISHSSLLYTTVALHLLDSHINNINKIAWTNQLLGLNILKDPGTIDILIAMSRATQNNKFALLLTEGDPAISV
jgi:hypothetical protein